MTTTFSGLRKRWFALVAVGAVVAVALMTGTLFAASERQQSDQMPLSQQSVTDAMDPGLVADLPAAVADAKTPEIAPVTGTEQVAPNPGGSDALKQWLSQKPETMGYITEDDAISADPDAMDWLLYQAVYKSVLTQNEADAVQAWYDRRPSSQEAPELLQYQPAYLDRPGDQNIATESLLDDESR